MKKITISLFLSFAFLNISIAQLTLESADGKKKIEISEGTEIGLKFPHNMGTGLVCESYLFYQGKLNQLNGEEVSMFLNKKEAVYSDANEIAKREITEYGFIEQEKETTVPLKGLNSITVYKKSRKKMDAWGGTLMLLSAAQGFIIGPFLDDDARAVSDKIVGGTFALGLSLTIWPKKKTYYFEQPAEKKVKRLWKLK